jgi:arsenite methyltransferase
MMSGAFSRNLYEHPTLLEVTGATIRPGGLELTRHAMTYCRLPPGATVVDVGCGTGATVQCLRREFSLNAFGVDRSGRWVDRRDPWAPLVQGDAACLPFRDGSVAAVTCECVLSLLPDRDAAWREFRRVLSNQGLAVVADIYVREEKNSMLGGQMVGSVASCIEGTESREVFESRLRCNGFALLTWEDHSRALKQLAAELVFACGSMKAFWGASGACAPTEDGKFRAPRARLGYFVCLARKEETP